MAFKNSWIKCLIWLGFLFVSSAITTGLVYAGVRLGGVPTILLFAVACYAARSCCKAYDHCSILTTQYLSIFTMRTLWVSTTTS